MDWDREDLAGSLGSLKCEVFGEKNVVTDITCTFKDSPSSHNLESFNIYYIILCSIVISDYK